MLYLLIYDMLYNMSYHTKNGKCAINELHYMRQFKTCLIMSYPWQREKNISIACQKNIFVLS